MDKKTVIKKVSKYQRLLNLNDWDIRVKFDKKKVKEINSFGLDLEVDGSTSFEPKYLVAVINFPNINTLEDSTIIHELVHILMADLYGYACGNINNPKENLDFLEWFNERTAVRIERIISKLK